jgi:MFS family permease
MKEEPTTAYSFNEADTKSNEQAEEKQSTLWHGLGLFGESYLLFSIGTLKPIWATLYPACFDESDLSKCAHPYLSYKSITYSVVSGVMIGMVLLGILANNMGRRRGSILTASLMATGAVCMTLSSVLLSSSPSILFPVMSLSLFIFGVGVGGEYPLSASSASERAMVAMRKRRDEEADPKGRMQRLLLSDDPEMWQTMEVSSPQTLTSDIRSTAPVIPLSPTNTTNDTRNSLNSQNQRLRTRGKEVLMVFSMQGAGIFANSLLLTFLLRISQRRDFNNTENELSLLNIWRTTYAIGTIILVYVLVSRIIHLTESEVWAHDRAEREVQESSKETGFAPPKVETVKSDKSDSKIPDILPAMSQITLGSQFDGLGSTNLDGCRVVPAVVESVKGKGSKVALLLKHYGVRLFGTSLTWLLWDIAFYGNKLFQSSFLIALTGEDATLMDITGASAINAFVALMGYYAAAAVIDDPDVGRLTLQQVGFIITGTLFLLCGSLSDRLSSTWLVIIYFGSSFFGQCGPNCTTFLIPAEIFPTEMRTMCHGISASAGKLGALIASILFNFITEKQLFLFSGYASFIACCITFMTIPETTTLDLYEIDKQWRMILDGKKFDYEGPANDPKHLSFYERNQNELC